MNLPARVAWVACGVVSSIAAIEVASSSEEASHRATALEHQLPPLLAARGGGAASSNDRGPRALTKPVPGLAAELFTAFEEGEAFFNTDFDATGQPRRGGLGPLYNAASCAACHNGAGRGAPVTSFDEASISLVFQWTDTSLGASSPLASGLGTVLNPAATAGHVAEGQAFVTYRTRTVSLADGTVVALRVPDYRIELKSGRALPAGMAISPRLAPPLIGGGLLDGVREAVILERADPDDLDGDGISGRPNWLRESGGKLQLGRFGWKANQATLTDQVAAALANEMGVTSPVRPVDEAMRAARQEAKPTATDIDAADLAAITAFPRYTAVPARADTSSAAVRAGAARFLDLGCESCHRATLVTGIVPDAPALSNQTIHPFTDLLLHDMGEGLADGRSDGAATGREWRTAPLWGLSLTGRVNRRVAFLHDGRARTLTEAVLWHGGEAARSAAAFAALDAHARSELLAFLESL
jgi:CxxC motif-containing protein (DUF1111 family)